MGRNVSRDIAHLRTFLAERGNESPIKSPDMFEPNITTLNAHTRYMMIK